MLIHKTTQIIFLVAAILTEFVLGFASTFYIPWRSPGFVLVMMSAGASCAAIVICIVLLDRRTERPL